MNITERSAHPSAAQIDALVEFLERNPSLAKGYLKTQSAREQSRRLWERITLRLNSMGGSAKTHKQWTKYWCDKKSAIKKKAAARAVARRKTGGGVEDIMELSEVEERVVALLGGEGFSTGDPHLGINPFLDPVQSTSSREINPSQEVSNSETSMVPQHRSPGSEEIIAALVLDPEQLDEDAHEQSPQASQRTVTARRLFDSLEGRPIQSSSQSILNGYPQQSNSPMPMHAGSLNRPASSLRHHSQTTQCTVSPPHPSISLPHPSLSPPHPTLSRTPTPLTLPTLASHSTRSILSPSRRGTTPRVSRGTRTRPIRARQSVGSLTSRHTVSTQDPPSQRRTEFTRITERFLRLEEQQLEVQRTNVRLLEVMLERCGEKDRNLVEAVTTMGERMVERISERDRLVAEAIATVGEGLKTLAESR